MIKKHIYLYTVISLIIFSAMQLKSQNSETINITNEDIGSLTLDICYSSSKDLVFTYGYKKLIVYDASTNEHKFTFDMSQYGQFEEHNYANSESNSRGYMFVDEQRNMLYFVTPNLAMYRLDISNPNNIIASNAPVLAYDFPSTMSSLNIIRWDSNKRRFYWAFGSSDGLFHLWAYDIDTQDNLTVFSENDNMLYGIYDIAFTQFSPPLTNAFYVSRWGWIEAYDADSQDDDPFYTEAYADQTNNRKKFFVKSTEPGDDKLFCLPYGENYPNNMNITVINTHTHEIEYEKRIGDYNVYSAAIFETNNHLVLGTEPSPGEYDLRFFDAQAPYDEIANSAINTDGFDDPRNRPYSMLFDNGTMYISKPHEIIKLVAQVGTYSYSVMETGYSNFYYTGVKTTTGNLLFANQTRSGIEKFVDESNAGFMPSGKTTYESLYYPDINKMVFFSKKVDDNSSLTMVDATNYSGPVTYEFDQPIGDCKYDKQNGKLILVLFGSGNTYLKVFNPQTNSFDDDVNLQESYCGDIFITPGEHVYIASNMRTDKNPKILILNASNYEDIQATVNIAIPPSALTKNRIMVDYVYNEGTQEVYFTTHLGSIGIDPAMLLTTTSVFGKFEKSNTYTELSTTYANTHKIVWASPEYERAVNSGKCYFIYGPNNVNVAVWECKQDIEETTIAILGESFIDLEVNAEKKIAYILSRASDPSTNKVYSINYDNELTDITQGGFGGEGVAGFCYNPYSYELLAYSRSNENNTVGVYTFDPEASNPSPVFTPFENKYLGFGLGAPPTMEPTISFNPETNKVFIPNGAHSNISVIDYIPRERLVLYPGSNWLSIPRHQRSVQTPQLTATEDVFAPENFSFVFSTQNLAYNNINKYDDAGAENIVKADYKTSNNPKWDYEDDIMRNVHSTRGYHLTSENENYEFLWMTGEQQDPNTTIDLYCKKENWIGYFLEEEQDVFDALESIVPDIYHIQHQNYNCWRYNYPVSNYCEGATKSTNDVSPGTWVCDRNRPIIKYGDMIKVTPVEDIFGFQWNSSGSAPASEGRTPVEYYTYSEQTDYETFVIELDTSEARPTEIGAFVNDSCVGACSVAETDSVVVLSAYMDTSPGDSVVFEKHYGSTKIGNNKIEDYFVKNKISGRFEKRAVFTGEKQDAFVVSFRKEKAIEPDKTIDFNINMYPNPAQNIVHFKFITKVGTMIDVSVLDISGRKVSTLLHGENKSGTFLGKAYLNDFNGNKLIPGIYFVRFLIGQTVETRKIIVH